MEFAKVIAALALVSSATAEKKASAVSTGSHYSAEDNLKIVGDTKHYIMFEFDELIENVEFDMAMCYYNKKFTNNHCSHTITYSNEEIETIKSPTTSAIVKRTKNEFFWGSNNKSYIHMSTKGTKSKILVQLNISSNEKYILETNKGCILLQDTYSYCEVDDNLYIRFADTGSVDNPFPTIKFSYDGKFFYSQSLC